MPIYEAAMESRSIWAAYSEEYFAKKVAELISHHGKAVDEAIVHSHRDTLSLGRNIEGFDNLMMPFEIEYQFAQDLAFIASDDEGAKAVAAVSLDVPVQARSVDQTEGSCTSFRVNIAVNSGVNSNVSSGFNSIADVLRRCSNREQTAQASTEELYRLIITLDRAKILSRLRCKLWNKPGYMIERPPPLCKLLDEAIRELIVKPKPYTHEKLKPETFLKLILQKTQDLEKLILKLEQEGLPSLDTNLKGIVEAAGNFTSSSVSLMKQLEAMSLPLKSRQAKAIKAFDKLANYSHICHRLVRLSSKRRFRTMFSNMKFNFLEPYKDRFVNRQFKHVHAEVQLAIFHRLQHYLCTSERVGLDSERPIVIGTSKAACYLCNLFLSLHSGRFITSATHGVLFEQWTIPESTAYTVNDRFEIQLIIKNMLDAMDVKYKRKTRSYIPYPPQSDLYHSAYEASASSATLKAEHQQSLHSSTSIISKRLQAQQSTNAAIEQERKIDPPISPTERSVTGDLLEVPPSNTAPQVSSEKDTDSERLSTSSALRSQGVPSLNDNHDMSIDADQAQKRTISPDYEATPVTVQVNELYSRHTRKAPSKNPQQIKYQPRAKADLLFKRRRKHPAKSSQRRRSYMAKYSESRNGERARRRTKTHHTGSPTSFQKRLRRMARVLLFALCGLRIR